MTERCDLASAALQKIRESITARAPIPEAALAQLLDLTLSKSGWEQEQARILLRQRGARVLADIPSWLQKQKDPRAKLEAAWLHTAVGKPSPTLVNELVSAEDPHIRTAAARQLAH